MVCYVRMIQSLGTVQYCLNLLKILSQFRLVISNRIWSIQQAIFWFVDL